MRFTTQGMRWMSALETCNPAAPPPSLLLCPYLRIFVLHDVNLVCQCLPSKKVLFLYGEQEFPTTKSSWTFGQRVIIHGKPAALVITDGTVWRLRLSACLHLLHSPMAVCAVHAGAAVPRLPLGPRDSVASLNILEAAEWSDVVHYGRCARLLAEMEEAGCPTKANVGP